MSTELTRQWDPQLDRYSRQMLFAPLGVEGQQRLRESRAVLIGVGALGTHQAGALVRAGVGFLRIVDRDFIELNNLQRQSLFDEQDIADNLPKAEAARRKLARINSAVTVEAIVADANFANIESLADGADILLDGTDNFETRYLINDLATKTGRPWVYGAAVGATGLEMAIIPKCGMPNSECGIQQQQSDRSSPNSEFRIPNSEFSPTPCIRCVFEDRPPPEANPTCDTAGVLGPVVAMVAQLQALDAIKILTGHAADLPRKLTHIDGWAGRIVQLDVGGPRPDCPCCGRRDFEFLAGRLATGAVSLCGRNAVQISAPAGAARVDFGRIAERLGGVANVTFNQFMLKCEVSHAGATLAVTVFSDGRAIIAGTHDPVVARTIYSRYVGS